MKKIWTLIRGIYLSVYKAIAPKKFETWEVRHLIQGIRKIRPPQLSSGYMTEIHIFKEIVSESVVLGDNIKIKVGKETLQNQKVARELARYCKDIKLKNVSVRSISQYGKNHTCTDGIPFPCNTLYVVAEV